MLFQQAKIDAFLSEDSDNALVECLELVTKLFSDFKRQSGGKVAPVLTAVSTGEACYAARFSAGDFDEHMLRESMGVLSSIRVIKATAVLFDVLEWPASDRTAQVVAHYGEEELHNMPLKDQIALLGEPQMAVIFFLETHCGVRTAKARYRFIAPTFEIELEDLEVARLGAGCPLSGEPLLPPLRGVCSA